MLTVYIGSISHTLYFLAGKQYAAKKQNKILRQKKTPFKYTKRFIITQDIDQLLLLDLLTPTIIVHDCLYINACYSLTTSKTNHYPRISSMELRLKVCHYHNYRNGKW